MPTKQQFFELAKRAAVGAAAAALQSYIADQQITQDEGPGAVAAAREVIAENEQLRTENAELRDLLQKALQVMKTGSNAQVYRFLQSNERYMQ